MPKNETSTAVVCQPSALLIAIESLIKCNDRVTLRADIYFLLLSVRHGITILALNRVPFLYPNVLHRISLEFLP